MGKKSFVGVRDVDENVLREFKSTAVRRNLRLGVALSLAMRTWLQQGNDEVKKDNLKRVRALAKVGPFDFGPGSERLSEQVDDIVYESIR